jgi:hypothetical protein
MLQHISQDVAQEFAHRSYQLQHIFVHSILEENVRKGAVAGFLKHDVHSKAEKQKVDTNGSMVEIYSGSRDKSENEGEQIDVPRDWYPFDPYVLPRSKDFVTDYFLEYTPSDLEEDEDMLTDGEDTDGSEDMDDDDI